MVRFYKSQKIIFKLHWIFFLIRIHCYFHFHLCKTQLKGSCLSALELNFLFVLFPSLVPVSVSSVKTRTGKLFLEIWRQCVPISPSSSLFIFTPFLSKLWFARTISLQSAESRIFGAYFKLALKLLATVNPPWISSMLIEGCHNKKVVATN